MEISVTIDSRKCWNLLINGKNPLHFGAAMFGGKLAIKRYLKRIYNIDLLTDSTIKRNYTEYSIKKIDTKHNKIYLIKEKRILS